MFAKWINCDKMLCSHEDSALGKRVPGPRRETLEMRKGRKLEGRLLGFYELAERWVRDKVRVTGTQPGKGPGLCLPARLMLRVR